METVYYMIVSDYYSACLSNLLQITAYSSQKMLFSDLYFSKVFSRQGDLVLQLWKIQEAKVGIFLPISTIEEI